MTPKELIEQLLNPLVNQTDDEIVIQYKGKYLSIKHFITRSFDDGKGNSGIALVIVVDE